VLTDSQITVFQEAVDVAECRPVQRRKSREADNELWANES